jgi:hypothetical protein
MTFKEYFKLLTRSKMETVVLSILAVMMLYGIVGTVMAEPGLKSEYSIYIIISGLVLGVWLTATYIHEKKKMRSKR